MTKEEILIKLGVDASDLKSGLDRSLYYTERELEKRKKKFKQSLAEVRDRPQQGHRAGVATNDIGSRAKGSNRSGGGHGALKNGVAGEAMVLARELSSGNIAAAGRTMTVLAQRMGLVAKASSALINPITGVIAGLVGGVVAVNSIARGAYNLRKQARSSGFSVGAYKGIEHAAERLAYGGGEAAQSAMQTVGGSYFSQLRGDTGVAQKYRSWGISSSGSPEDMLKAVADRFASMSDDARRLAMAQDLLGDSYKDLIPLLEQGAEGIDQAAKRKITTVTSGDAAVLEENTRGVREGAKAVGAGASGLFKNTYSEYSQAVNGDLAMLAREVDRGERLDKEIEAFRRAHKPSAAASRGARAKLERERPEEALKLRQAEFSQTQASRALEDRLKPEFGSMVDQARSMTGHIRPRLYTVTDRMRTAMNIDDLEAKAQNAYLSGDDDTFKKLRGEAEEMRKSNPWLKYGDQNPTEGLKLQLDASNKSLSDVVETLKKWDRNITSPNKP